MEIGLKTGGHGPQVARLHRVLAAAGWEIEAGERERNEFGSSTEAAVRALQRQHGLAENGCIDEPTLAVLIAIEERISININEEIISVTINEGTAPTKPKPTDEHQGKVTGRLVDQDGAPIAGVRVELFAQGIRSSERLSEGRTGQQGEYSIHYDRPNALNLLVRAYDDAGELIASSPTYFAAPATIQINFTSAADGVVRQPSTYTALSNAVAAQLGKIPLTSLQENSNTHELEFLASSVGAQFADVAYLYIAEGLGAQNQILPATFFGIFYEGIPASLDAALQSLPEAGIDSTFEAQVLSGVLAHSHDQLGLVLTDATSANILPASYAAEQAAQLTLLDAMRTQSVGSAPYVRGKTSLNDLLAAGGVTSAVQTAFTQAYADNGGMLGPTWKTLRANKNLPAADLTTLNTTLSLGELLTGNIPLVKNTLGQLSTGSLASIQNLALLDQNDWIARITAIDPDATSIPTVLPNETPQQKIARFALVLAGRFASRYSTTAFAGALSKATTTSFARSKEALVNFIVGNPKFNFKRTSIDQFISANKASLSADAVTDLKTAQRLFRVSPHFATVDALQTAGHTSAQSIYFQGRDNFITAMTTPFGSASLAKMAYARAQITYATALMAYSRYNGAFNGVNIAALGSASPDPTLLDNLPDMQALFGSFDYFQCEDCQSIYSPAAYLVDLLQYLSWFPASGGGVNNARDAFLLRRPDVQYIALDCNNTNTTMPYIDLVNELLEAAIAPPSPAVTVIDTTGTSAERRALPQQISPQAYNLTAQAVFPLGLPFDLPFAQTSACIGALGTTRAVVLSLFAGNPVPASVAPAIAAASMGIGPEMQAVIIGTDGHQPWQRWGLPQFPTTVIDPGTRQPYVPTPSNPPNPPDWTAALGKVPVLMNKSGLALQQLYQLLEVVWVTQGGVTLEAGFTTQSGVQILTANIDAMTFTGLTADVLDRANRFLRLWTACGLQMWELDWALEEPPAGALDNKFLVFLAGAIQVRNQLNLLFQEVLSFWMPLETRDVTNHLGDEDTVTPSTYSEVFRNPAVLATAGAIFVPVTANIVTGATNASPIAITTAEPHGYQSGHEVSVAGAGGNTAANGTFTITVTGPTTFTLNGSAGNGNWTSGGTATGVLVPNQIILSSSGTPTAEQNAITAALGLSGDEISAIIIASGASPNLTLPTLNALLQYQRLSTALSLSVSDLILWIQLTNYQPFTPNPADTLEFCRRLAVLQATGLAVHDLDYLVRGQSASQSSLTFTPAAATAVLQAISAAIAKLPTPQVIAVTGASNTSPITITTALANGLQTGAQVTISGALGNTAANGAFTIATTTPTSFTLNGSAGNGAWTSGGTITVAAYDNTTIQTIFVAALAAATSTTANVVTPVLLKTNVLLLNSATITQLVNESSGVNPADFPALINAFTMVAKAAALYTALNPTENEFAFLVANAALFNWLDPSALPLTPVSLSPYAQLECLLRALKLDQRQSARSPKLFDILTQWLPPNALPATTSAAISGPVFNVTGATNATPIAITTSAQHGLQTGAEVIIAGVMGNLAANGTFSINVTGPSSFTLDGSTGSGAYTSGGTVSQPSLAFGLNANVSDVLAIAAALNAQPPAFSPAAQPGSMVDIAMLTAIAAVLNVTTQYGISGAALVQLAATPATAASATAAMGALQAQYAQSAWFGAIQPVEDTLRQSRRDALVAYMLGPGPSAPVPLLLNTDDIYNYYLIDPEMCPCALMTRLLQASLAIQQFVQQCFLNLSFAGVTVPMTDPRWDEWSWRQQYRLWQANREVFLYPENYVLPELRTDASPFFTTLESDMQSGSCDEDLAETALENYLRSLLGVANLQVVAHYNETQTAGSQTTYILHVFAKTSGTPAQWFYRTRTGMSPYSGSWSAWQQMSLDIASQQVLPVIWDQRLYLIWPIFKQISQKQSDQSVPSSGGNTQPAPQKFWSVEFAYSQLSAGEWQPKQTLAQKAYFATPDSAQAFTFRAYQDSNFNLQIQVYFVAIEEAIAQATAQALQMEGIEIVEGAVSSLFSIFGGSSNNFEVPAIFPGVYLGSIALVLLNWTNSGPQITTLFAFGSSSLVAQAALPMPESPLAVQEAGLILPAGQLVDISQETTYPLITTANLNGYLPTPAGYGFSGQNMIYGNYTLGNPGSVPLNVLCVTSKNGQPNSLELLGAITNPTIVVPFQEAVFDSTDPFFVYDATRTYLVQPAYFTISSSPQEITSLKYMNSWNTRFEFLTFYHPYARTFLREYEIGGVPQLMSRNLQTNPQAVRGWTPNFNFQTIYNPKPPVVTPYPGATGAMDPGETALDFAVGDSGAYSLYNWETFYHIPMFVASQLLQNQQFQDAINWLEYIFNPSDTSGGPTPQRFWEFAPFNAMNASDWVNQQVQILLQSLAVDTSQGTQGINDTATLAAIQTYMQDPFDPHAIASLRISAYGKATVISLLNAIIAWGDWYYAQYTAEFVSQAEQLYILADMLLGPQPQEMRLPDANQSGADTITYASLKNIDAFSNALVNVENVIVAPEPPQSLIDGTGDTPTLPQFPGAGNSLLFCIPPNDQILAFWDTVAQRLYNIRHCLNLQGQPQPLPLYAPPINPLALIEAAESGSSFSSATQAAPIYRFPVYLQKAIDLTNDVRSYGALILSALEKEDAENLAVLRANQEVNIQTLLLGVKTENVQEATDQITALQNQQAVIQVRSNYYSSLISAGLNPFETGALALQAKAMATNGTAIALDITAGEMHLLPSFSIGIAGFGGTPNLSASFGGENMAGAASAAAGVIRAMAGLLTESAGIATTMGGYQRRADEWSFQLNLATAELTQMASQITAAQDRLNVAQQELNIQNTQITNAQAVSDFLTNKYTNAQLYNWMLTQLTTVYTQAYQLAFSLALQAQNAYQYELGSTDTFIQFGYWDSQYKGLTAGESLLFDLRRMEAQYLAENSRELELTKHISLALTNALALVTLRETGTCQISLDEVLFELDHPGLYFRRLRSVAVTIPCVTGPYTGVNATLTLTNAMVRTTAPGSSYQPQSATAPPNDPSVLVSPIAAAGTQTIATSNCQNDAGLFDVNLHDDRWLPFEGQGAISTWNLTLDPRDNNFDFTTITDVILHLRYTARGGGDQTAANNVRTGLKALTPPNPRTIMLSVQNTFPDGYYTFMNPAATAPAQTLTLPLSSNVFPYANLAHGIAQLDNLSMYVVLSVPASGNTIPATFSGSVNPISLAPMPGQTTSNTAIEALTAQVTFTPAVSAPQTFTLTINSSDIPPGLATKVNGQTVLDPTKVEDILLVLNYSIV